VGRETVSLANMLWLSIQVIAYMNAPAWPLPITETQSRLVQAGDNSATGRVIHVIPGLKQHVWVTRHASWLSKQGKDEGSLDYQ
jgi:hypothetical protein